MRAHDSNLLYLSDGVGTPIGTNTADPLDSANPPPSEFEVDLKASELDGVPGIPASTTAAIYAGMLQDGCPFLVSIDPKMTLSRCRGIAGGVLSFGIRTAQKAYLAMAARLLQAKQDQMDRVDIDSPIVPLVSPASFSYNLSEQTASADYTTLRELGSHGLWPAYEHVVSVSCSKLHLIFSQR